MTRKQEQAKRTKDNFHGVTMGFLLRKVKEEAGNAKSY